MVSLGGLPRLSLVQHRGQKPNLDYAVIPKVVYLIKKTMTYYFKDV